MHLENFTVPNELTPEQKANVFVRCGYHRDLPAPTGTSSYKVYQSNLIKLQNKLDNLSRAEIVVVMRYLSMIDSLENNPPRKVCIVDGTSIVPESSVAVDDWVAMILEWKKKLCEFLNVILGYNLYVKPED